MRPPSLLCCERLSLGVNVVWGRFRKMSLQPEGMTASRSSRVGHPLSRKTPALAWLWRLNSLLAMLPFPLRLLALVVFLLSASGGLTFWQIPRLEDSVRIAKQNSPSMAWQS